MATVTKFPQSYGTGWTTPENALSDNGSYATLAFPKNTYTYNYFYNFDFQIPAGSVINSITLEVQYKLSTNASTATFVMAATKDTVVQGTEYSDTAEPTTDTVRTSTTNGTWTAAELNSNLSSGFNIRIGGTRGSSNTAVTGSVDYVKATIDYTAPTIYDETAKVQTLLVAADKTEALFLGETGKSQVLASIEDLLSNIQTFNDAGKLQLSYFMFAGTSNDTTWADANYTWAETDYQWEMAEELVIAETGRSQAVIVVVTGSDEFIPGGSGTIYDETGKIQTILSAQGQTDSHASDETGLIQTLLAVQIEADTAARLETGIAQAILAAQRNTDIQQFTESGKSLTITTAQDSTETVTRIETSGNQIIFVVSSEADEFVNGGIVIDETGKMVTLLVPSGRSDTLSLGEVGKTQIVIGTSAQGSNVQIANDTTKTLTILSDHGAVLQGINVELGKIQALLVTSANTDTVNRIETAKSLTILTSIAESDGFAIIETGRTITILSAQSLTDSLALSENSRIQTLLNVLSESETQNHSDLGKAQTINVIQIESDTAAYIEPIRSQTINSVSGGTEALQLNEVKGQGINTIISESDSCSFNDTGKAVSILTILTKDETADRSEAARTQSIIAVTEETDTYFNGGIIIDETGKLQVILTAGGESEAVTRNEEGSVQTVLMFGSSSSTQSAAEARNQIIFAAAQQSDTSSMAEAQGQVIYTDLGEYDSFNQIYNEIALLQIIDVNDGTSGIMIFTESGKAATILAASGKTDIQDIIELERTSIIAGWISESEALVLNEANRSQILSALNGKSDTTVSIETQGQIINFVQAYTSSVLRGEIGREQTGIFVQDCTDQLSATESRQLSILAQISGYDSLVEGYDTYNEVGLIQTVSIPADCIDVQIASESRQQLINTAAGKTDTAVTYETSRQQIIIAVPAGHEGLLLYEITTLEIKASGSSNNQLEISEAGHNQIILAEIDAQDQAEFVENRGFDVKYIEGLRSFYDNAEQVITIITGIKTKYVPFMSEYINGISIEVIDNIRIVSSQNGIDVSNGNNLVKIEEVS